ncbi:putative late blight resistance protein homolog R1A-10 [Salvia miltiorrhiza]|uniref:putative late blight resistance protein homolog R1A-10 n=1 Tax=Salvia miltiorrhiza TaxID=226208 RepID=UPI0025ABACF2|nr:putative late blight resistance protein homolog R1A-10 [Salvia miltiorrhiza]
MAAYSAVVSLEQQLKLLLDSDQFPLQDQRPQLQSFHQTISSLQKSVETIFPTPKHDRETAGILETLIRDSIYQAQDAIESFLSAKSPSFSFPQITQHIDPIASRAQTLADSIRKVKLSLLDGAEEIPPPPRSGVVSRTFRIVGQETDKKLLSDALTSEEGKLQILPVTGMAGIGKTTLARSTYDDPKIKKSFPFRAWVTVSQDYHVGDILARLLNSMESRGQKAGERVYEGNDDQLKIQMHQSLYNNKYLVVIDDMWDTDTWDKVRNVLPDNKNGSRIILTTRILSVAKTVKSSEFCHEMQPLDEENSWILLCDKAFEGKPCPPHLEKTGREIAKNCGGLPLSLTVIGGLLSQERQTEEYWQTIEEDTNAAAGKGEEAYSEILSLSYNHLPAKLKGCFLYLGAFPEDSDIPLSKLARLWVAEGFLVITPRQGRLEKVAEEHLLDLTQRNLITVRKISSDGTIKTCGLHDSLRDLAVQESGREKFFHSIRRYANAQGLEQAAKAQRRVSVHKNILICLKDVYRATKSISDARTLIYAGSHHHHPMPLFLTYDLLRVLDAYTVYFIRFPQELAHLIHLRYLSLTYNGKLASSLSKLQNLQVLIVRRQPRIIFVGKSFLPDEFWGMQQLRHLVMTETNLPKIPENLPLFANLQSLTDINAASCTREVLKSMPNLKKLGMWVEKPGVVGLYLDELEELEVFKFTVLNPSPSKQVEFDSDFFLPETLRKLSLSGCGLPWEAMGVIVELPNLEVLKLRELAFNGEEWCMEDCVFEKLKFLMIEYLNLKSWIVNDSHFPCLEQLYMRHCYNLEGIPLELGYIGGLKVMELVDCSPKAVESAEEIKQEQEDFDKEGFEVRIYCSYEI